MHFALLLMSSLVKIVSSSPSVRTTVPTDIVQIVTNRSLYDPYATPNQNQEIPTRVFVTMYIEGLSSFQAQSMDFHVDIYFQEHWEDSRLRHGNSDRVLIKDPQLYDQMWHPDLYFANAKEAAFHYVTAPNFLVWIWPNGSIYLDTRVSLKVMCMMDLSNYPLDSQSCDINILSYAYTQEQLQIFWKQHGSVSPISKNPHIKLPDMFLLNIKDGYCSGTYEQGNWSCVKATFEVERQILHHILQSYTPTALIVIISWFSFWLDVDAVPGRVSLCITTLLTLATQSSAARMALPQVSYIKAIDVWMGTCMAFVFGVMIEFTVVNFLARQKPARVQVHRVSSISTSSNAQRRSFFPDQRKHNIRSPIKALRQRHRYTLHSNATANAQPQAPLAETPLAADSLFWTPANKSESEENFNSTRRPTCLGTPRGRIIRRNRKFAQKIDRVCRVFFPVTFVVFNCFYWFYYVHYTRRRF